MCGRIGLPQLTSKQFAAWQRGEFDWDEFYREEGSEPFEPSWNVKPTQVVEVLYARKNALVAANARWWLVPKWFGGTPKDWKATTFNAKIETADHLPSFRGASRCAIPASGYYEWTGEKGDKQPWWITTDSNAPVMFFAGILTKLNDGSKTCAILTRPALEQIKHIHHRTPVILGDGELGSWLTGSISTAEAKSKLGLLWDGRMKFHPVRKLGIKDDGPELIEPFDAN